MARREIPGHVKLEVLRRHYPNPMKNARHPVACYWCGVEGGYIYWSCLHKQVIGYPSCRDLEWDHWIPLARGGAHADPFNIVMSCPHCNRSRNSRMPWEWEPKRRAVA